MGKEGSNIKYVSLRWAMASWGERGEGERQ